MKSSLSGEQGWLLGWGAEVRKKVAHKEILLFPYTFITYKKVAFSLVHNISLFSKQ